MKLKLNVKLIENGVLPRYSRDGDACLDCCARIADDIHHISIPPHSRCIVNLGFAIEIPIGYEGQVRPRSGLTSIAIDNGFGTVDSNYRGEVRTCVINNTDGSYDIKNGDRICQLAIREAPEIELQVVKTLSHTTRGDKGFGSSGI